LGELNRRRRRVWVDGEGYDTESEAAEAAGVSVSSISRALKTGEPVKGHTVSAKAPGKRPVKAAAGAKPRPLLIWPPGEGPMYTGLRRQS
jgi:transposase